MEPIAIKMWHGIWYLMLCNGMVIRYARSKKAGYLHDPGSFRKDLTWYYRLLGFDCATADRIVRDKTFQAALFHKHWIKLPGPEVISPKYGKEFKERQEVEKRTFFKAFFAAKKRFEKELLFTIRHSIYRDEI